MAMTIDCADRGRSNTIGDQERGWATEGEGNPERWEAVDEAED